MTTTRQHLQLMVATATVIMTTAGMAPNAYAKGERIKKAEVAVVKKAVKNRIEVKHPTPPKKAVEKRGEVKHPTPPKKAVEKRGEVKHPTPPKKAVEKRGEPVATTPAKPQTGQHHTPVVSPPVAKTQKRPAPDKRANTNPHAKRDGDNSRRHSRKSFMDRVLARVKQEREEQVGQPTPVEYGIAPTEAHSSLGGDVAGAEPKEPVDRAINPTGGSGRFSSPGDDFNIPDRPAVDVAIPNPGEALGHDPSSLQVNDLINEGPNIDELLNKIEEINQLAKEIVRSGTQNGWWSDLKEGLERLSDDQHPLGIESIEYPEEDPEEDEEDDESGAWDDPDDDSWPNWADWDDDGDGTPDNEDEYPHDPNRSIMAGSEAGPLGGAPIPGHVASINPLNLDLMTNPF